MIKMGRTLCRIAVISILCALCSPRGVQAGTLTITWDAVATADGYVVYWGTSPGEYWNSVEAGNGTSVQIDVPYETTPHYFAVQAYTSEGLRSSLSDEVTSPSVSGSRPPRKQ